MSDYHAAISQLQKDVTTMFSIIKSIEEEIDLLKGEQELLRLRLINKSQAETVYEPEEL